MQVTHFLVKFINRQAVKSRAGGLTDLVTFRYYPPALSLLCVSFLRLKLTFAH